MLVRFDPTALPPAVLEFLRERHLATLTTLRSDGTPHVVPVGFTWDDEARVARVITSGDSQKAYNALRRRAGRALPGRWAALADGRGRGVGAGAPAGGHGRRAAVRPALPGPAREPGARRPADQRGPGAGAGLDQLLSW